MYRLKLGHWPHSSFSAEMDFSDIDSLISVPSKNDQVYKDECAFSFAAPDDRSGLFICLRTFLGIGPDFIKEYIKKTGNSIFLQYKIIKTFKEKGGFKHCYHGRWL